MRRNASRDVTELWPLRRRGYGGTWLPPVLLQRSAAQFALFRTSNSVPIFKKTSSSLQ